MTDAEKNHNAALEAALVPALEGDREARRAFFTAFLSGPLFVPERTQDTLLSHQPAYPHDLVTVLGIQDGERVVVPVFSSADAVAAWFGKELKFKTWTGERLVGIAPDGWWLALNPGQEIEKEISPWEIQQLRSGAAAIDSILEELGDDGEKVVRPVELVTPAPDELPMLREKLVAFANTDERVRALYLLKERGKDLDDNDIDTILVGADVTSRSLADLDALRAALRNTAELQMIGGDRLRVSVGAGIESLALGVFKSSTPFFQRERPWWKRVLGLTR